jgi:hypothetical protein
MIKLNRRILLVVTSLIAVILELVLLLNIFPQTGMGRIILIPFWIIVNLLISIWLSKKNKTLKRTILSLIIIHVILFHIMLWSWPQSAALEKNLVEEFYGKVL